MQSKLKLGKLGTETEPIQLFLLEKRTASSAPRSATTQKMQIAPKHDLQGSMLTILVVFRTHT